MMSLVMVDFYSSVRSRVIVWYLGRCTEMIWFQSELESSCVVRMSAGSVSGLRFGGAATDIMMTGLVKEPGLVLGLWVW